VNRPIARIFGVFTLLFAVLVGYTSYNAVFAAEEYEDKPENRRSLIRQVEFPRGVISASDGAEIAVSEQTSAGETPVFERRYPEGELFAHPVGYAFFDIGSSGLERFYDEDLSGEGDEFESIIDDLSGEPVEADDLRTNLDPQGQETAMSALGDRAGSIVALEPDTGKVLVMASTPTFDPNTVPDQLDELNQDEEARPLVNRATQEAYPPGSTMKVVTTAAALDTGEFTPESVLSGESPQIIGGAPLENFGGQSFGSISLTDALTNSVNTVFGQVGEQLGSDTMFEYMERFGFDRELPLDYPSDQLFPSGVYTEDGLLQPGDEIDSGRVAIGQGGLLVTPLQMAMVTSAVANDGALMAPRLGDQVVASDGRVKRTIHSEQVSRVMSTEASDQLAEMMTNVVQEGSGTAAALSGVDVAGKTGTAEAPGGNQPWFIAFAPSDEPQVAIAVTLEPVGATETGGEAAAPLAKQVLEVLLDG
jgi:peptidoglycan glycosyltransferase